MDQDFAERNKQAEIDALKQALESVRIMKLPEKIDLSPDSFSFLGTAMARRANEELNRLREKYQDKLPFMLGVAEREIWFSVSEGLAYMSLMQPHLQFTTAHEYAESEYGWAMTLWNLLSLENDFPEIAALRSECHFMERLPDKDLLTGAGLLWLAKSSELIANGKFDEALNWIYEGLNAIGLASDLDSFDGGVQIKTEEEKSRLSSAGKTGASAKHAKTKRLKEWVREKLPNMYGSDRDIAASLAAQAPPDLVDKLNDVERVIYDFLRKQHRTKSRSYTAS